MMTGSFGYRAEKCVSSVNRAASIAGGLYFCGVFVYLMSTAVVPLTRDGGWRGPADVIAVGFYLSGIVLLLGLALLDLGLIGQALRHAQQRRDADAAGEQQAALRMLQRKVVAWRADVQQIAFVDRVVHAHGAAARGGVAQHGDAVAVAFSGVVAQRVLARDTRGQQNVHVRARRERRQCPAVGAHQFEQGNVQRKGNLARHAHLQHLRIHGLDFSRLADEEMLAPRCEPAADAAVPIRRICACATLPVCPLKTESLTAACRWHRASHAISPRGGRASSA